jgi:hypothetical protein
VATYAPTSRTARSSSKTSACASAHSNHHQQKGTHHQPAHRADTDDEPTHRAETADPIERAGRIITSPAARRWVYRVALAVIALCAAYGLVEDSAAALWGALAAALVGLPLADANVNTGT